MLVDLNGVVYRIQIIIRLWACPHCKVSGYQFPIVLTEGRKSVFRKLKL